jgi:cyclic pyranopterin phosphate synthase
VSSRPDDTTSGNVSRIVDVGDKDRTERHAVAEAAIVMTPDACAQVVAGTSKGNALEAARIAALQGLKRTPELLPFCHPVVVVGAEVTIEPDATSGRIAVRVAVRAFDRTGVEMEALTGASIGALCLYDTAKAYDRSAVIERVRLLSKSGGRGGDYTAPVA